MRVLYCHIVPADGAVIHANEFSNAYAACCGKIKVVHQGTFYLPTGFPNFFHFRKLLSAIILFVTSGLFWAKVAATVVVFRPEVIIFRHTPSQNILLSQLFFGCFYPILLEVNAVNEIEPGSTFNKYKAYLDRLAIRRAGKIFVVSTAIKRFLVERKYCDEEHVAVIVNGVNEKVFLPDISAAAVRNSLGINADTFMIGFIGSMKKWHGIENVINAAKICKDTLGEHIFLIVGDGELRSHFENMSIQLGLKETVRFVGKVDRTEVPNYLAAMDVFLSLHASQKSSVEVEFHGSPLKIFEYMAMAKPIIASPRGQIGELILHKQNGYLIDGEDSFAVAERLRFLKENVGIGKIVGNNARSYVVKNFTWRSNAERVKFLCEQIRHVP